MMDLEVVEAAVVVLVGTVEVVGPVEDTEAVVAMVVEVMVAVVMVVAVMVVAAMTEMDVAVVEEVSFYRDILYNIIYAESSISV